MSWKKVGKHEFNVEAVKSMTLSQFSKQFQKSLGDNCDVIYYKITGKKKSSKKKKETGE